MRIIAPAVLTAILVAGCASTSEAPESSTPPEQAISPVVVVTHDSFAVPDELVADFEQRTGYSLTFVAPGDTGLLVNQLVLTKDAPLGDVAYGVDNTFATRAITEGVFDPYESSVPAAVDADTFEQGTEGLVTAIDFSDVCVNAHVGYFADAGLPVPTTFADLAKPEYAGLLSAPNPATSSPGLAFLLATIAAMPSNWQEFWANARAGGVRTTSSWSDSYYVDFSAPNYGGAYPLVVSYASSPPSEVVDGEPTTVALLDTCFRQVEYAGVLAGGKNPQGAQAVIDWMLSDEFQNALPTNMYVYPVSSTAQVPADWEALAPLATQPWTLDPIAIDANRDDWIEAWSNIVLD